MTPLDPSDAGSGAGREGRTPWPRRLDVRLGAVAGALVLLAIGAVPPMRAVVRDALMPTPGAGEAPSPAAVAVVDATFVLVFVAATVVVARRVAARLVTQRLAALTHELAGARGAGPELDAADEIGRFARAMDDLRDRAREHAERVEGRDRSRREWLGRVSHDLRTPLTALNACLARARTTAEGMVEARERETILDALRVAHLDADRFQALASDLLDVARLEGEDAEILREPVPPGELVRRVAASLKFVAEDFEVELHVDTPAALPELVADGHRLARALENLLRNALQHARSAVHVQAVRVGDAVQFTVSDDGPGLPAEPDGTVDLARLALTPSRPDSSGIGLLVVRRVAALHGGSIGGRNGPDGGAQMWMRIPRTPGGPNGAVEDFAPFHPGPFDPGPHDDDPPNDDPA
ncbi:MAG: HAMP domain-containing sensor histidine kinase [Planctomycetota bacterium]